MTDVDIGGMSERILEQATVLFVTRGYTGVSMREISEACGLSKAGLYYHYKDKEDLFLAILKENLNMLEKLIDEVEGQGQNATEKIHLLIQAIFTRIPSRWRAVIQLASQEMDKISPLARAEFHRHYEEQFIGRIQRILDAGVRAGELRAMDTGLAVWSLLGLMYPFLSQDSTSQVEPVVEFLTALFLDGVRAR